MLVHVLNAILSMFVIWAEDMGQFHYHMDPDTRKIARRVEKSQLLQK